MSTGATEEKLWRDDSSTTACHLCQQMFGIVTRKHHCRGCGQIICHKCSGNKKDLPKTYGYSTAQRVCDQCAALCDANGLISPQHILSQRRKKAEEAAMGHQDKELQKAYATLGVTQGVSDAEFKSAVKASKLKSHPDRGGTQAAFEAVNRAFEIITVQRNNRQGNSTTANENGPAEAPSNSTEALPEGVCMAQECQTCHRPFGIITRSQHRRSIPSP